MLHSYLCYSCYTVIWCTFIHAIGNKILKISFAITPCDNIRAGQSIRSETFSPPATLIKEILLHGVTATFILTAFPHANLQVLLNKILLSQRWLLLTIWNHSNNYKTNGKNNHWWRKLKLRAVFLLWICWAVWQRLHWQFTQWAEYQESILL